jgi:hypothetical protein
MKTDDLAHYSNGTPVLELKSFLNGKIIGYGIIQNRKRKVIKKFEFIANASWDNNNNGTIIEKMIYDDGRIDNRTWNLTEKSHNHYIAKSDDVLNYAEIFINGNAMKWSYQMYIPVGKKKYKITFEDWMFLLNEKTLINRNYFKKFGFNVGELTLFMQKIHE